MLVAPPKLIDVFSDTIILTNELTTIKRSNIFQESLKYFLSSAIILKIASTVNTTVKV
jgi:hypothetical protein